MEEDVRLRWLTMNTTFVIRLRLKIRAIATVAGMGKEDSVTVHRMMQTASRPDRQLAATRSTGVSQ